VATEVILPKLGLTMEEAILAAWEVAAGDEVAVGQVIAVIETDKIETDLPSPVAGVVAELLIAEGDTVPVGTVIALVEP
jgi:pyruvate/2-oxoglutarate dehydrogenase complex dihydrolipoamide acyltransferase (E2) component